MANDRDSIPNGLPVQLFHGYAESTTQMVGDSGIAMKIDDTTAKPKAGYTVIKYLSNHKPYYWNGYAYVPFGGNIPYYTSFAAFTGASPQLSDVCILDDSVYGGGVFTAHNSVAESLTIDSGFIFPTTTTNIVWVRKVFDPNLVKMDWYNIKTVNGDINYFFSKAIAYLKNKGKGGIVQFGIGHFISTGLSTNSDNITIEGEGENVTFIDAPASASLSGGYISPNSGYRYVGWQLLPQQIITYDDSRMTIGRGYINLRVSTDADSLHTGDKIFINGGASHYDQNYGEFNIIDSIIGTRIYLRYNLSRDYSQALSAWTSALSADFTPPAANGTNTINFTGDQPSAGIVISIGNDLYQVVSSTSTTAIVLNISNKGNGSSLIPTGTHIFLYRGIIKTPTTVYNTTVRDITFNSRAKSIIISNSIKTHFENVRFNWSPLSSGYGIWLDGDDGRDFTMSNCEVRCSNYVKCQFARSFADIKLSYDKFFNAALEFSEFNSNYEVANCTMEYRYSGLTNEVNSAGILIGATTTNANIHDNNIAAANLTTIFGTSEIQSYSATSSRNFDISHNTIICDSVYSVFVGSAFANIHISYNTISGTANYLYGLTAQIFLQSDSRFNPNTIFGFGSRCVYDHNSFSGYVDGFGAPSANVWYTNNYTNRFGAANAATEFNSWGNVLYTHYSIDSTAESFRLIGNTFKGWNLLSNSLSLYGFPLGNTAFICDNHFVNTITYPSIKDSVISLQCPNETTIPLNQIYLGTGKPYAKSTADFSFIPNTTNTFYINNANTLFYNTNLANSVEIFNPAVVGYNKYIRINQPSMYIDLHNGNTSGTGFGFTLPANNFPQGIIYSGTTTDNNGTPRQGYITYQLGNTSSALYNHSQLDSAGSHLYIGLYTMPYTLTAIGTNGNQTINTASGTVNIAAAGTNVTVTNSLVTASSIIDAMIATNDANKTRVYAVTHTTGSFTIYVDPAPAAAIAITFKVTNQ